MHWTNFSKMVLESAVKVIRNQKATDENTVAL